MCAGTTRKQATAGALLRKVMRFPNLLRSDCKVLEINVLGQEESVPLALHPDGEEHCVGVPSSGGEAASLVLALRDSGAEATTAASDASQAAGPAEASKYLAQHGVLPYVHRLQPITVESGGAAEKEDDDDDGDAFTQVGNPCQYV
ncbi:unnamed protein product [Prorocentrum cordatum]|uniref:Uncharacterized protein n=1 Tax=Prorocentrum cordatum TaxID=2364126 RepID=A0ABN9UHY7_9DINO|nr:unnamed protein product [Polarella glacialis]